MAHFDMERIDRDADEAQHTVSRFITFAERMALSHPNYNNSEDILKIALAMVSLSNAKRQIETVQENI